MDNQPHIVVHGNYIAHVNNYNDYNEHGRQQTQLGVCRTNDGTVEKGALGYLNENLATDRAKAELAKYQKEGILDEFYQPINLTRPQMGCIVIKIGDLLGLESQWKDFGCLWNIDSELLRTQFGRGKDSEPTRRFYKRIYDI